MRAIQNFEGGEMVSEMQAVQRFVAAIVKQSVEDHNKFVDRGIIKAGEIVPGVFAKIKAEWEAAHEGDYVTHGHAIGRGLKRESEANELLLFLKRDMDFLIEAAALNVNPDAIRQKLGITA